jgi:UDP-N-acetylmuramyl pentapeptide phosphotransferase/UDP-N-acetylglucosamine-1-phosphate transferase
MNHKNARLVLIFTALVLLIGVVSAVAISQDTGQENNSSLASSKPVPTPEQGGMINLTMIAVIFLVIVIVALAAYFFGTRSK